MSWFNLSDNINLLGMLGGIVCILFTYGVYLIYVKRAKEEKGSGDLAKENWDGIKEYKNPLPLGWAVAFLILCVWGIWYMYAGYPLNAYSQIGEYNEEVHAYNSKFEEKWQSLDESGLAQMGESIFLVECFACHGILGDGINGKAADLTNWGNEKSALDFVKAGSEGMNYDMVIMTPGGGLETEQEMIAAVAFMMNNISKVGKSMASADVIKAGQDAWFACAICHGDDGKGLNGMSPDLTTYGTSDFVKEVLNRGKVGTIGDMPKFNDGRLTALQKQAVGLYILSLSK